MGTSDFEAECPATPLKFSEPDHEEHANSVSGAGVAGAGRNDPTTCGSTADPRGCQTCDQREAQDRGARFPACLQSSPQCARGILWLRAHPALRVGAAVDLRPEVDIGSLPQSEPQAYACVRLANWKPRPGIKLRVLRRFQKLLHDQNWPTSKRRTCCVYHGSFPWRLVSRPWRLVWNLSVLSIWQGIFGCASRRLLYVVSVSLSPKKKVDVLKKRARSLSMQSWGQLGMRCCQV